MALIPFIRAGVDAPLFLFPFTGVGVNENKTLYRNRSTYGPPPDGYPCLMGGPTYLT